MGSNMENRMNAVEKALLIDLISKHRDIIEKKKTDAVTVVAKANAWKEVEVEFNSHGHVNKRTWRQLRKAWENIKAKRKRQLAETTRKRLGSSGGSFIKGNTETQPELKIAIASVNHYVPTDGDSDMLEESVEIVVDGSEECSVTMPPGAVLQGGIVTASCSATPSSGLKKSTPRSIVEMEAEARLQKVHRATEDEAFIAEMRKELALTDIKVKENELASSVARRKAAEVLVATRRANAEAAAVEAKARIAAAEASAEEARVRLVKAQEELEREKETRKHERELYEMKKEVLRRKMECSPPLNSS